MEKQTVEIINRVLPILFLLVLGYWIQRTRFLSEAVIEGLRKLVVNLSLPAVLFVSFLSIDLEPSFLVIFVVIFLLCLALFGLGRILKPRLEPARPHFPFLMTGFEYGMLGISLFASAYGLQNIGYIAVIDLGHEIFIWFVFLGLLLALGRSFQRPTELFRSFLKSPVILAILAGILLNLVGLRESLSQWPIIGAFLATLQFLAAMTIPLILLIVGYGIKLNREGSGQAARVVLIRLLILIPLAFLLNRFLIQDFLGLERGYQLALFTLLVLPPPFIIPLFMRQDAEEDRRYVNTVLTLHTVATIAVFTVFFTLNPTI